MDYHFTYFFYKNLDSIIALVFNELEKKTMQKLTMIAIIFLSFFCFGFSGKIFIGDLGLYHEVYIEVKGNKLIIKDWESGNEYEFKYDGKGRGNYKGYDWQKEHFLELHIQDNGKGTIFDCDTGFYYPVDLGNLRRLKRSRNK